MVVEPIHYPAASTTQPDCQNSHEYIALPGGVSVLGRTGIHSFWMVVPVIINTSRRMGSRCARSVSGLSDASGFSALRSLIFGLIRWFSRAN